jgi:hypothetical protein
MDAVKLLDRAREAGLAVATAGDKLIVRGPRLAEPVVRLLAAHKRQILAALGEATDWPARHREALVHWGAFHDPDEAARLAWGEMVLRWHQQHGERVPGSRCAGCDEPIANAPAMDLGFGSRAHLDDLHCLIRYGKRWRGAATRALVAMGLKPLADEDEYEDL